MSRTGRLVRLSAALAARPRGGAAFESALDAASRAVSDGELEAREVEEALLQSYLFLGYPAALTALDRWRARGLEPPGEEDPLAEPERVDAWTERGEELCSRVYGGAYGKLRDNVRRLHPAMDRWMIAEGYGKVLARPGLDLATRELCVVALLAAEGWREQLHSHLRGALRAGADPGDVRAALEAGLEAGPGGGADREGELRELWARVRERADA